MKSKQKFSGTKIIIARGPRPSKRPHWWLLGTVGFVLGAALGIIVFYSHEIGIDEAFGRLPFQRPFGGQAAVNILLMGTDNTGQGLADTLILARVDTGKRRVAAVSIPRDTRSVIRGHGVQKINSAHAFGGRELTEETVSQLLGVPVDYYVSINSEGLEKLVDIAGGIELEVEKRMRYRDRRGGLNIDLQPGLQRLDGEQAVGYVRYRHDALGDLARIQRQQKFLRELTAELAQARTIPRIPSLVQAFSETVDTNLSIRDLTYLAGLAKKINPEDVAMASLQGEPRMIGGISYLQLEAEQVRQTLSDVLYDEPCAVEVVDASGDGQARRIIALLKARDIDVIATRVANEPASTSQIIDYKNRPERARQLVRLVSCRKVVRGTEGGAGQDFTIILGRDLAPAAQDTK